MQPADAPRPLLAQRDGPAMVLTLNRPEKRNALSIELREMLADAIEVACADPGVTAIGLTGTGSAFCAGMDVTQFGGDEAHKRRLVESSIRCFGALTGCPKPTVALVNGHALGGGLALALACDVRIASPTARFGFPELARGIPPSFAIAMSALPPGVAADLALSGRMIDAPEAQLLGLVSRISDTRAALSEIAAAPAAATAEIKRRIRLYREGASVAALLRDEERALRSALLPDAGSMRTSAPAPASQIGDEAE